MPPKSEITALLAALREGDHSALDRLFPLVYAELRDRADRQLSGRRAGETIFTTALVHEAYLKLIAGEHQTYQDRIHFFAVASRAMRQILVDYAHRSPAADPDRTEELIAVSEALNELELLDQTLARVVELRFFGGLSVEETGDALGLSPRTIERDWRKARAFLYQALRGAGTPLER